MSCEARRVNDTQRFQLDAGDDLRTVVLVEGVSDQLALDALAKRGGRDLHAEDIFIVPMGGTMNIGSFLQRFGPSGLDIRVVGLCDAGEESGVGLTRLEEFGAGDDRAIPRPARHT